MGACASKPKVLGDKPRRSRRHSSSSTNDGTNHSISSRDRSSLRDDKGSMSSSAVPDDKTSLSFSTLPIKEEMGITPNETENVGSKPFEINDNNNHDDKLPSIDNNDHYDQDNDARDVLTQDESHETEHQISGETTKTEEEENDVVEAPKLNEELRGPTPTDELQDQTSSESSGSTTSTDDDVETTSPAGDRPQNDVVEAENPDVILERQISLPRIPTENDVVETENYSTGNLERQNSLPHIPTQNDVVETENYSIGNLERQNSIQRITSENDAGETKSSVGEDSPPPSKNDVVETLNPGGELQRLNDVVEEESTDGEIENDVVESTVNTTTSSSTRTTHTSEEEMVVDHHPVIDPSGLHEPIMHPSHHVPTINHLVVQDHFPILSKVELIDEEDDGLVSTSTNSMPSTFAF